MAPNGLMNYMIGDIDFNASLFWKLLWMTPTVHYKGIGEVWFQITCFFLSIQRAMEVLLLMRTASTWRVRR